MTPDTLDALVESLEKRALVMTDDPVYRRALDAIAALRGELAEANADYMGACGTVAQMHYAATGSRDGPKTGVIEDVAAVAAERDALRAEVEALREELQGANNAYAVMLERDRNLYTEYEKLKDAAMISSSTTNQKETT